MNYHKNNKDASISGNEDQARNQDNANRNLEGFVGRGYNHSDIDRVGVNKTLKIEAVVMNPTEGGFLYEGPHYSHSDGFLYYVDIVGHKIGRYDTKADKNVWVDVPGESPTFIIPISGNTGKDFILGQGKRVVYVLVDWDLAKVVFTGPMYSPQHQGKFENQLNAFCSIRAVSVDYIAKKFFA